MTYLDFASFLIGFVAGVGIGMIIAVAVIWLFAEEAENL